MDAGQSVSELAENSFPSFLRKYAHVQNLGRRAKRFLAFVESGGDPAEFERRERLMTAVDGVRRKHSKKERETNSAKKARNNITRPNI